MFTTKIVPQYQARVEKALSHWLPRDKSPSARLHDAMTYVIANGGKRIRPIFVYATGHALGILPEKLDGAACAVELIHSYSLVHDDLPAMDNDDLRRGKPTCHKAFDEAIAILTGDALQSLAFYILASDKQLTQDCRVRLQMIEAMSSATGSYGMAGGQAIDLAATGRELNLDELETMHMSKTGALIRASVMLGALSDVNIDKKVLEQLLQFAEWVGLAFQIQDDILDIEGTTSKLGKPQGADLRQNKPTYPSLLGLEESKHKAKELQQKAIQCLSNLDINTDQLQALSEYIVQRDY